MKVNSTPIRTSENFKINDYEIEDTSNIKANNFNSYKTNNIVLKKNNDKEMINIRYGISSKLNNQIYNKANFNYKIKYLDNEIGVLDLELNNNNNCLIDYIEIDVKENASCNLFINYKSTKVGDFYHNGLIYTRCPKNSKTNIFIVNNLNNKSTNLISFENELSDNSILNYTIFDFGASKCISNYYSNLKGNNSNNTLNTVYIGSQKQEFDFNYLIENYGINSKAYINTQGALKDNSKKNFKGTIDFKKGCKKAIGDENEFCVLLSDKSISRSLPMLLCSEEDVIGTHSSASGYVSDNALFYIMSRGLSKKEAEKLLVRANFNKAISMIKSNEIKEYIEEIIDKKL